MFGQTFDINDLAVVGLLVILEGVLSIDNALVLGLLAKRLPKHQQNKALSYGLIGAFVFRVIAIATATVLIQIRWVKLLGGLYLAYVSIKHFVFDAHRKHESPRSIALGPVGHPHIIDSPSGDLIPNSSHEQEPQSQPLHLQARHGSAYQFWSAVAVIELTDIAFAVDSILAAVGLVAGTDKTWVVIIGGFLGVILMRFAAAIFIRLLEKFPRFEIAAYLLVLLIGVKLAIDWGFNTPEHPHRLDFHNWHAPAFWVFWGLMLACLAVGFIPHRKPKTSTAA